MKKLFTAILLLPLNLMAANVYVLDGGTGWEISSGGVITLSARAWSRSAVAGSRAVPPV